MSKRLALLTLLLCVLSFTAAPAAAQNPTPVIIDTDMVTDDWMAIAYLLKQPAISVKAITVTGTGWAFCDAGVRIALGLVAQAEYGTVPVSCWREEPLQGENAVPPEWRTTMEVADSLNLPEGGAASDADAVELFTSTVQDSPDKVTVLALGPMTNIGQALETTPSLVDNIEMIYVMGGAVDAPGSGISEENTTAEWNIFLDPHAARLVIESGAPITLVPLDATNDVPVTPEFMTTLEAAQNSPASQMIYNALLGSSESIENGGYYFWDPLVAVVLADPGIVTLTPREVTVIDTPGAEYGRIKPVGNGSQVQVATQPDAAELEQQLIEGWNS